MLLVRVEVMVREVFYLQIIESGTLNIVVIHLILLSSHLYFTQIAQCLAVFLVA